jgi:hypothetical protein
MDSIYRIVKTSKSMLIDPTAGYLDFNVAFPTAIGCTSKPL